MEPLIAAVRSGDAKLTAALLEAGADPDAVDEHGTPALRLAVDAFDLPVVDVLVAWARLDDAAPDGRTPLLRAIDRGACEITDRLVGHGAKLWVADAEGRDALATARYWHEADIETELRRGSGSRPVERGTVRRSESGTVCAELSSGGLTIRNGHTAILTALEPRYGIHPPFDELLSRALAEPDVDHEVWWATTYALEQRHDTGVWDAAAALCDRPNPLERYFGAEVLRLMNLFDERADAPYDRPLVDLFLRRVACEPDPRVTRVLTAGLVDAMDPRAGQALPSLTRHLDAKVREQAVGGLRSEIETASPEALVAATERVGDANAAVRRAACRALAFAPPDTADVSDLLAGCLDDPDRDVRVEAAARLALRADPRGDEILRGLDPTDEDSPYHWLLDDVYRHRASRRRTPTTHPGHRNIEVPKRRR
ncbi:ankyrin repeat domain-containing protein [Embleya sp. NPDC050493]|uniref:ankyrin repeat domain-containing protein n=1 Tax=Embleya sp. NPDC050493 TaxID=3363989 RepID=UPI0037B6CE88